MKFGVSTIRVIKTIMFTQDTYMNCFFAICWTWPKRKTYLLMNFVSKARHVVIMEFLYFYWYQSELFVISPFSIGISHQVSWNSKMFEELVFLCVYKMYNIWGIIHEKLPNLSYLQYEQVTKWLESRSSSRANIKENQDSQQGGL